MSEVPPSSARGGWLLAGGICLLVFCGLAAWRHDHATAPRSGGNPHPASSSNETASAPPVAAVPENRQSQLARSDDEKDDRQIDAWLADDKVSKEDAARNLWRMASDVRRSQEIRKQALDHALTLAEDPQFKTDFLPDLSRAGVWTSDLADALLSDVYNRSGPIKLAAAAAMLPDATGGLKDELRDTLRFLLDSESEDDAALIRLAERKAAEPEKPAGE